MVLDTGAVTRGSGSKNEDKERNVRKWFVDHDLIDGVILLPENLFYNTTAAGIIVVLNKRKSTARKGKITLLNASKHFKKGRPKNYLPEDDIRTLAATYLKGETVDGEMITITAKQAEEADYNLNPSRWVGQTDDAEMADIPSLMVKVPRSYDNLHASDQSILETSWKACMMKEWREASLGDEIDLAYGKSLPAHKRQAGRFGVFGSNGLVGTNTDACVDVTLL